MYFDYKKDEITKEGNENIITTICKVHNIEREILLKYIELYDSYPFVALQDTKYNQNNDKERLKIVSRSFKIKKIKTRNE